MSHTGDLKIVRKDKPDSAHEVNGKPEQHCQSREKRGGGGRGGGA